MERVFPSEGEICNTVLNFFNMVYSGKDAQKAQLTWAYIWKKQNLEAYVTVKSKA